MCLTHRSSGCGMILYSCCFSLLCLTVFSLISHTCFVIALGSPTHSCGKPILVRPFDSISSFGLLWFLVRVLYASFSCCETWTNNAEFHSCTVESSRIFALIKPCVPLSHSNSNPTKGSSHRTSIVTGS